MLVLASASVALVAPSTKKRKKSASSKTERMNDRCVSLTFTLLNVNVYYYENADENAPHTRSRL